MKNISISCLPLLFLEPNIKFDIFDNDTNIDGTYILNKISFNLNHNSTMVINAISTIDNNINRRNIYV